MAQIRLHITPELEEVLAFLRSQYRVLSEAEIIKVALAEKFKREMEDISLVDEKTEQLIARGSEDFKKGRYTTVKTDAELDHYLKNL